MGKTSIALNIALHVGKNSGKAVAVFSLEMSREQLVSRLLAGEGLVQSQKLMTGDLNAEEWKRIAAAAQIISRTDIRIDDNPTLTVADMDFGSEPEAKSEPETEPAQEQPQTQPETRSEPGKDEEPKEDENNK